MASEIKNYFPSRWGSEGRIVQADYSQLEVIVLAALSGDEVMKNDLLTKDMHCVSASFIDNVHDYNWYVDEVMKGNKEAIKNRKAAKSLSFALQYGAGVQTLAKQTKLPLDVCETFVTNYYLRYSGVKKFQDMLKAEVKKNAYPSKRIDEATGWQLKDSTITMPHTGRIYKFYGEVSKSKFVKSTISFSPTAIVNYPIQGTATGDIVPLMLGELYHYLYSVSPKRKEYRQMGLMINTIHDSIMFDVHELILDNFINDVYNTLQSTTKYIKGVFDWDFPMPLKVEIEAGLTWGALTPIKCGR